MVSCVCDANVNTAKWKIANRSVTTMQQTSYKSKKYTLQQQ